jgi:hypothetical protein
MIAKNDIQINNNIIDKTIFDNRLETVINTIREKQINVNTIE